MRLRHKLSTLKTDFDAVRNPPEALDVVAILTRARDAVVESVRTGQPLPDRPPVPPEWEHSRNPVAAAIFAARRRVGG